MKKPVNLLLIIPIALCVIAGAVLAIFLSQGAKPEKAPEYALGVHDTKYFEVFRLDTYSQLNSYCTENKMPLQTWEDGTLYRLANVPINDRYVTLLFETDDGENFKRISGRSEWTPDSKEEIFFTLESVQKLIAEFFGLQSLESFHVYSSDGSELNIDKQETIDGIAEGQGTFSVSAIDAQNKYWNLTLQYTEDRQLVIEFFCSADKSIYESGSEDIYLAEPKE